MRLRRRKHQRRIILKKVQLLSLIMSIGLAQVRTNVEPYFSRNKNEKKKSCFCYWLFHWLMMMEICEIDGFFDLILSDDCAFIVTVNDLMGIGCLFTCVYCILFLIKWCTNNSVVGDLPLALTIHIVW